MLLNYHIGSCVMELGCGSARVVSRLPAEASAGSLDTRQLCNSIK